MYLEEDLRGVEPLSSDFDFQLIPGLKGEGLGLCDGFVLVRLVEETGKRSKRPPTMKNGGEVL